MNRIIEVKLTLINHAWEVAVTKEFAIEHGGGRQTFIENGGFTIHRALDVAKEMVTLTPGQRTDLDAPKEHYDLFGKEGQTI